MPRNSGLKRTKNKRRPWLRLISKASLIHPLSLIARIDTLKTQRDIIVATLARMITQARTNAAITPAVSAEFLAPNAGKTRYGRYSGEKGLSPFCDFTNRSRSGQDQNNWRKGLPGNSDCR